MVSFTTQNGLAGIQMITVRSIGLVQIFKSSIEAFITHGLNITRDKYEGLKSRVKRGYQGNLLRGAGNLLPTICTVCVAVISLHSGGHCTETIW